MRKRVDMSGQRFDRLTVICFDHRDSGDSIWRCRCDCGNEVSFVGKIFCPVLQNPVDV